MNILKKYLAVYISAAYIPPFALDETTERPRERQLLRSTRGMKIRLSMEPKKDKDIMDLHSTLIESNDAVSM